MGDAVNTSVFAETSASTCSTCRDILATTLTHHPPIGTLIILPLIWRKPRSDFQASLRSGCALCHKLNERFFRAIYELGYCSDLKSDRRDEIQFSINDTVILDGRIHFHPFKSAEMGGLSFRAVVKGESPHEKLQEAHRAMGTIHDVTATKTFDLARQWLRICENEHIDCAKPNQNLLPKRIIDVSEDDSPKLVDGQYREGYYATLSYCWGSQELLAKKEPLKTTTKNLIDHFQRIPTEKLPLSIQHAIDVTRELCIRYLWVDSLCIVQDDRVDKLMEIGKMADIYQNAYCTISAAGASDCHAGFLMESTDVQPSYHEPIVLRYQKLDGELTTIALYQADDASVRNPIHMRAWTFQEQLLSHRLLTFSSRPVSEVFWQCHSETEAPESQTAFGIRSYKGEWEKMHQLLTSPASGLDSPPSRLGELEYIWKTIIEEYSSRSLSFQGDRFEALSAVATAFHQYVRADYLAGIWRCWILSHLIWRSAVSGYQRSTELSCPSWSWLSVDCSVEISHYCDEVSRPVGGLDIVECKVSIENPTTPFGNIISAKLVLQGHIVPIRLVKTCTGDYQGIPNQVRRTGDSVDKSTFVRLDLTEERVLSNGGRGKLVEELDECFCLPIKEYTSKHDNTKRAIEGLVLYRTSQGYRRIGWFSCNRGWNGTFSPPEQSDVESWNWLLDGFTEEIVIL